MLYSAIALTLASATTVLGATSNIELFASAAGTPADGLGLSSIHEGAGINYFLLGEGAEELSYDDETKVVSAQLGTLTASLNTLGDFLAISVTAPQEVTFDGDKLVVNGTSTFYAAKNVNDPYNYSKSSYAVIVAEEGSAPADAIKIEITKKGASASSSVASSSTASATSSATSSVAPSVTPANGGARVGAAAGAGLVAAAAYLL
ncbi:cell wall protein Rhd3p [[Candida] anglica]|uniref:Cell wall protein Rhd3p n=1 Tax=[Candida] anglica TaxID=148631 RepID=A0ABP0EAB3_9ASCO